MFYLSSSVYQITLYIIIVFSILFKFWSFILYLKSIIR